MLGDEFARSLSKDGLLFHGDLNSAPDSALVVIESSKFIETVASGEKPQEPDVAEYEEGGLPVLFGKSGVSRNDGKVVLHNDIIAGAFFLLTRYEEILCPDARDSHGRFLGRHSIMGRNNVLHRAVVDEYGKLLRDLIREIGVDLPEPPAQIRRVYLTHDMDLPFAWHRLRPAVGAAIRSMRRIHLAGASEPLLTYLGCCRNDPNDCFDWICQVDNELAEYLGSERVQAIHFIMSGGASPQDGMYDVRSRFVRKLLQRLKTNGCQLGLHASYEAGENTNLVMKEKNRLCDVIDQLVESNRNHYLCSREPEDYRALIDAGIGHDFTMGFADQAGFRLGTTRSYKWFDPVELELTDLEIHPTTVMECVLDRPECMGLDFEEALAHCRRLIDETRRHNGDLTLLWHNTELTEASERRGSYQRRLYQTLLEDLRDE